MAERCCLQRLGLAVVGSSHRQRLAYHLKYIVGLLQVPQQQLHTMQPTTTQLVANYHKRRDGEEVGPLVPAKEHTKRQALCHACMQPLKGRVSKRPDDNVLACSIAQSVYFKHLPLGCEPDNTLEFCCERHKLALDRLHKSWLEKAANRITTDAAW